MFDFYNSEPMHYWAAPSTMSKSEFKERLEIFASSEEYLWGEKYDGNWSRAIINPNGRTILQSRGISKHTGTYGEIQDKVFWWSDVAAAFDKFTVLLGEVYLRGGIDRDCGSILRSLTDRAHKLQSKQKLEWRIFDVLAYDGEDLQQQPFSTRITYIPKAVAKIDNPLVIGVEYKQMDNTFFDNLNAIFARGGEGAVCYSKTMQYIPGKRGPHAWDTIKVKQEICNDIDVFITRTEPSIKEYTGKDITHWLYWEDSRTGEKLYGEYYPDYHFSRRLLTPITKGYYNSVPGAVYCGVYKDDGTILEICKVAGLTDDMRVSLRDNFEDWHMSCLTLGGMMISDAGTTPSIRHPYIKNIRQGDMNPRDCTLAKIIGG